MDLLQKLTLYDLLGYTLPGVLAVWLYEYSGKLWQGDEISVGIRFVKFMGFQRIWLNLRLRMPK